MYSFFTSAGYRSLARNAANRALKGATFFVCAVSLLAGAGAEAQLSSPQRPTNDSAIVLGDFSTGTTSITSITFTDAVSENLVGLYFDPGPNGAQEFSVVSLTGCYNAPAITANTTCTLTFKVNAQYTGPQLGVLHIITSSTSVSWGLLYRGVGSQVEFTPGTISSIAASNIQGVKPRALATDGKGDLFFAGVGNDYIDEWIASSNTVVGLAGTGAAGDSGDNGPAYEAAIGQVRAMTIAPNGDLYFIGDGTGGNLAIRRINLSTGVITTEDMIADFSSPNATQDLVVDSKGRIYVSLPTLGVVAVYGDNSNLGTVAGNAFNLTPQCGDLTLPGALAFDPNSGTLFIADGARVVSTTPNPSTLACTGLTVVAGTGSAGYSGDGGPATAAQISNDITGLAIESDLLYIADTGNNVVRQADIASGPISTIAGNGTAGYSGDNGPAIYAELQGMGALKLDPAGNLYLADSIDDVIRKITQSTAVFGFELSPIGQQSIDSPKTVTVTDSGNQPLVFTVPASGANPYTTAGFIIDAGGTCPEVPGSATSSLTPGQSCTVNFGSVPTVNGPQSGTLDFLDNAAGSPQTVQLYGTGTNSYPVLQIAPTYVPFTNTPVGTTSNPWTLNVSNTSGVPAIISSLVLSDSADFKITSYCGSSLAAYSSCNILVYFTPQSAVYLSGTLTLTYDGKPSPLTVQLNGTGTSNGITVIASPTYAAFSNTPVNSTSNPWTINLSNESGTAANISGIALSDPTDFSFTSYCGSTLGAYSSCTILVYFTPKTQGYIAGTLTITDNGSPTTQVVQLNGTGTSNAITVTLSPNYVAFGNVMQGTTSNPWTLNLSNQSGSPATINSIVLSDSGDFAFTSYCGTTLAAYSSCNILVYFTPKSVGYLAGTLTVTDNGTPSTQVVQLNGTGTSNKPTAFVSPNNINFGNQPVGTSANPWTVTYNNTSSVPLTISSIGMSNTVFSYTTTCGSTLPANSTCNFYITFTPTYVGPASGSLNIYDNTAGGYEGVTLSGNGTSSTPVVQLSPTNVQFSQQYLGSPSNPWTLNFSNEGGTPVTISSIVLSDTTDFSYTSYCGPVLGAYSSCTILAYFNPQGTQTYNATLTVNSSGAPAAAIAYLNGYGAIQPTGYAISVNPTAFTVKAGGSASAAFNFAPYGGYKGTVSFACMGLPSGASCKFSPSSVTADGSNKAQASQLIVTTSGVGAQSMNRPSRSVPTVFYGMPPLFIGLLLMRRRKAPRRLLAALIGLVLMSAAAGCGTSFGGGVTPTGTSSVTVTATGAATAAASGTATTTQTATFTLTITQ